MNDLTPNWLTSPRVQAVCDAQRAEADKAKWALEFLEADISKLGHFYLEIGDSRVHTGGWVELKNGRYVASRWFDRGQYLARELRERSYNTLVDALTGMVEEWE